MTRAASAMPSMKVISSQADAAAFARRAAAFITKANQIDCDTMNSALYAQ